MWPSFLPFTSFDCSLVGAEVSRCSNLFSQSCDMLGNAGGKIELDLSNHMSCHMSV